MELNGFKIWDKTPNTVDPRGTLFHQDLYFNTKNKDKNRKVRVYLPSSYDFNNPNKRFPVLYMLDGKNLFDDYTSFVGEWKMDEIVESLIEQKLSEGIIVVGIDAPKNGDDRTLEMTPPGLIFNERCKTKTRDNIGYANLLGDFIFKKVKPLIDRTFFTLKDKSHTAMGGSSMGGLMTFYLSLFYKEYIGYSMCYSPAFFLYKWNNFFSYVKGEIVNDNSLPIIDLYVGGTGFEKVFVNTTFKMYEYFKSLGFNDKQIRLIYSEQEEHNEKAWQKFVPGSLQYFNYIK